MTAPATDSLSGIVEIVAEMGPSVREFVRSPLYSAFGHGIAAAWFHDRQFWAARELKRLGLVERRRIEPGYFASIPTALCLAIRQHMEKES